MAADCSPGRKPGVNPRRNPVSPRRGRQRNSQIGKTTLQFLSPLRGSNCLVETVPRAYARGYTLPPADAGSLNRFSQIATNLVAGRGRIESPLVLFVRSPERRCVMSYQRDPSITRSQNRFSMFPDTPGPVHYPTSQIPAEFPIRRSSRWPLTRSANPVAEPRARRG
jgi:hypothetical protein